MFNSILPSFMLFVADGLVHYFMFCFGHGLFFLNVLSCFVTIIMGITLFPKCRWQPIRCSRVCITSLRQAGAIFSRYFQSEIRFPSESRELSEGNHGAKIYSTDDKSNSVIKFNFIQILQINKVATSSSPVFFFILT